MILAEDVAKALQSVQIQMAGCCSVAEHSQIHSEVVGGVQGVGVIAARTRRRRSSVSWSRARAACASPSARRSAAPTCQPVCEKLGADVSDVGFARYRLQGLPHRVIF
jgi:hypothetical protein